MVQKIGASYIAKRIADHVMAPPAPAAEPAEATAPREPAGEPDGQVVHDEEGRDIGRAYRVPGVAVYVVWDGYGDRAEELERCLAEPESRLFFRTEGRRITGLIYASDPNRPSRRVQGLRADDV